MGQKTPVSPSLTIKLRSESVINHEIQSKIFGHEKTPETLNFQGFSHLAWSRLTLAELRSAASLLEAVLGDLRVFSLDLRGFFGYQTFFPRGVNPAF